MGTRWRHRYPRALLLAAVVVVGAVAVAALGVGAKLRANITVLDVNDALTQPDQPDEQADADASGADADASGADDEPTVATASDTTIQTSASVAEGEPLTLLVMGSDTREGQGDGFGSAALIDGARSDTTMLVHLSADRENVTVVSIPRDLMVTLPECTMADGTRTYAYSDRFNAAFSIGGPECTIRAATELTGLPVNHFVVVDFTAFERAIDALGGVEVCLTRPVTDPLAGLDLPAGVSRVDGAQGLAFVRARTSLGDGSDLARIERQQGFLASLVREATSRELLTDPLRLVRSLDAATQSLTMDAELAWLPHSAAVARSLAGIDPADVSFVTYPYLYNDDFLTVREDPERAGLLLAALAADVPWPFPASAPTEVAASEVSVDVVDAVGDAEAVPASLAATSLTEQGFTVVGRSTSTPQPTTQVRYPEAAQRQAATVAAAFDGALLVRDDSLARVTLVVGDDGDLTRLRTVTATAAQPSPDAGDGEPGGVEWESPAGTGPTGETSTADKAVCAS